MAKKIIAVAGATGAQGGGLAQALLRDGTYAVRAITRQPESDKARALAGAGADVVRADLDDVSSLGHAFAGAHGAFCVTNYWEYFSPEREFNQASNMANATQGAEVEHVIWSTLEDTRKYIPLSDDRMPTLMGKYKVPHFDGKGEADNVFRELKIPTTFLLTSFYWENFIYFGAGPKKGPDGKLYLTMPMGDKKLPGIAVADIGKCALAIFKRGSEFIGKYVGISGDQLTGKEMSEKMTRAFGREVLYQDVPPEVYRAFGFPGADDMGNMFQFKRDFNEAFCKPRDPKIARSINPELQNFDTWLAANKSKIPLE
jgi:uncharacterized protein YbjT (DUF2867 family)